MKLQDPMKTVKALVGDGAIKTDRCCGESGTLAVTRPDISTQVRFRKQEDLMQGMEKLGVAPGSAEAAEQVKILTSCPSCLQGLSRYEEDTGAQADYIVIEMARHILGESWMEDYVRLANLGGIERVLV
jgi:Fe-S oxidoreductase